MVTGVHEITACNRTTCEEFVAKRSEGNAPVPRAQYYWQHDFRICMTIKAETGSVDANGMDPLLPIFQHKRPHTGRLVTVCNPHLVLHAAALRPLPNFQHKRPHRTPLVCSNSV